MKTYKHLYHQIISFENLLLAAKNAQKGKRFKESTARFNFNLEHELIQLHYDLSAMTYSHGGYTNFPIFDPKKRLISAAPYRDRVVHHALCNFIEPIFDRSFIDDTYACRKGKGVHAALNRYTKFSRSNKYVLKCDIKKYFQSIDHGILFDKIATKIKCKNTLWLIKLIINSKSDESNILFFKNDDLFTPFNRKKGIPIGNLTSQFFANIYLDQFDRFMKQTLRLPYIRYVDDFVTFSNSKEQLNDVKLQMESFLDDLRLQLHETKSKVYRVRDGVNFLGYRLYPTHRLLKKDNGLRMRRKLKQLSDKFRNNDISFATVNQSIQSWIGHASHANTYNLRKQLFANVVFKRETTEGASGRLVEQQC